MHLLLTGGGTAGHILPNLAIIEQVTKDFPEIKISYIGSNSKLEQSILKDVNVDYFGISTGKLRRYFSIQNFIDLFKVPYGFLQSLRILNQLKPNLVFSKGGYVALPVVFAARLLRVPVIIHESDSIPGLTTKLTAKIATEVWAENPAIHKFFPNNFKQVNLPIRSELRNGNKKSFHSKYNFSDKKPNLLVMGGSQGAQAINNFIYVNINSLTSSYNIFHICGAGKVKPINKPNYRQIDYMYSELADAYAWSDLVLSRAGASSIAELSALRKKSILIPLPKTQSRGEQYLNAEHFITTGLGELIEEHNLSLESFNKAGSSLNSKDSNLKTPDKDHSQFTPKLFSSYLLSTKN